MFTPEDLAEMAADDAEIEATFELTSDELKLSANLDRLAIKESRMQQCKSCEKRKRSKEEIAACRHAYYLAHKEEYAARCKKWAKENRERKRELNRGQYQRNREKYIAYQKKYNQEHAEKVREYKRNWYRRNKNGQAETAGNTAQDQRAAAQA